MKQPEETENQVDIKYVNGVLEIDVGGTIEKKEIALHWQRLTEEITDWYESFFHSWVRSDSQISERFFWNGMPTWWINPVLGKDTIGNTRWLDHLMVLYLAKVYSGVVKVETDDELLGQALRDNFAEQQGAIVRTHHGAAKKECVRGICGGALNALRTAKSLADSLMKYLMLFQFRKKQEKTSKELKSSIWIRTLFPANWIERADGQMFDRHFSDAIDKGLKYGVNARYLVYLAEYAKDKNIGFIGYCKSLYALEKKSGHPVVFVDAHLKIKDILSAYWSTMKEYQAFKNIENNSEFISLFNMGNIDISRIMLRLWVDGYRGGIQKNKLNGMAMQRFFEKLDFDHTVVTYGEIFYHNRASYHLLKKVKPLSKIVAVQHAMNVKYKLFSYHRSGEFKAYKNKYGMVSSPKPDKFLVQGDQYRRLLSEFYPDEDIVNIGSLKYDHFSELSSYDSMVEERIRGDNNIGSDNIILLLPSVGDYKDIIDIFSSWNSKENWILILCPHPAIDIREIKKYQSGRYPWLDIRYETKLRTYDLMPFASLVISGFSTTAIEALYFGIRSVRFVNIETFPQFSAEEENISVFYDGDAFIKWFDETEWGQSVSGEEQSTMKKVIEQYFYRIDGKAADRMWRYLSESPELPHNNIGV